MEEEEEEEVEGDMGDDKWLISSGESEVFRGVFDDMCDWACCEGVLVFFEGPRVRNDSGRKEDNRYFTALGFDRLMTCCMWKTWWLHTIL